MSVFLTLNAGSTNVKLARFNAGSLICEEKKTVPSHDEALQWLKEQSQDKISAVAHRVVHGGDVFNAHTIITPEVYKQIKALARFAPLQQPPALKLIDAAHAVLPDVPHIACFDTVFHRTIAALEQRYALPESYFEKGYKRYGFHGLSYESAVHTLSALRGSAGGRVMVAHLGGGASLCALKDGKSVATSMGFSTLDGLMMSTRCGNLDAGMVLQWLQDKTLSLQEVTDLLYHNAGLKGVSGLSADVRQLEASNNPQAALALSLFCHMAIREIGSATAVVGGLDALVFTGGIGENSALIRAAICDALAWMELLIDDRANKANAPKISARDSQIEVYVLAADEESVMARACKALS